MKQSTPGTSVLDWHRPGVILFVCQDNFRCGVYRTSDFLVDATDVRVTPAADQPRGWAVAAASTGVDGNKRHRRGSVPSEGPLHTRIGVSGRARVARRASVGAEHGRPNVPGAEPARAAGTDQSPGTGGSGRPARVRSADASRPSCGVVPAAVNATDRPTVLYGVDRTSIPHPLISRPDTRPKLIRGWVLSPFPPILPGWVTTGSSRRRIRAVTNGDEPMTSMYDGPDTTPRWVPTTDPVPAAGTYRVTGATDEPPNSGHWPGAERRRHAAADVPGTPEYDGQQRRLRRRPATPHDVTALDAADRHRLAELVRERLRIDPVNISSRAHVARTRRGLILLVTEYEPDPARPGQFRHILGMPVTHHHVLPVVAGELPASWVAPARAGLVDLVELTARIGLPADQQSAVAGFVGEPGPWSESDAAELVKVWRGTGTDGVYRGGEQ